MGALNKRGPKDEDPHRPWTLATGGSRGVSRAHPDDSAPGEEGLKPRAITSRAFFDNDCMLVLRGS